MSGRGRGRHLPINYPDGLACKPAPTSPYPRMDPSQIPNPPVLTGADRELLQLSRRLRYAPAAKHFRVHETRQMRDFVRYSDRYLDATPTPFDKVLYVLAGSRALMLRCLWCLQMHVPAVRLLILEGEGALP